MQLLGYLDAVSEAAAIERAVVLFNLDGEMRKRLAVNLGRYITLLLPSPPSRLRVKLSRFQLQQCGIVLPTAYR